MQDEQRNEKLIAYFPVTIFIALTFIFEAFGMENATNLILATLVSLLAVGVQAAQLKEKKGEHPQFKTFNLYQGLLTLFFILIIGNGILHWYKLVALNIRFSIFMILMLIYFVLLFRAVGILFRIRFQEETGN